MGRKIIDIEFASESMKFDILGEFEGYKRMIEVKKYEKDPIERLIDQLYENNKGILKT